MADTHTGSRQVRWVDLEQVTQADLDRMQRLERRALGRVLRQLFRSEVGAIRKGVLEGFAVSPAASNLLAVDVTAGLAFVDVAGLTDATLDSTWRWLEMETADTDVELSPGDATHNRKDLIVVEWAYEETVDEFRNVKPAAGQAPASVLMKVYQGPGIRASVIEGVPGAVPAEPALPAGAIKLATVTVAANAVDAGDITVVDKREFLPTCQQPGTLAAETRVAGNLYVDANAVVAGDVLADDLTLAGDATITGDVDADGLTLAGNAVIAGNAIIAGDLLADQIFIPKPAVSTTPAITARSNATGTPDAADDCVIVEVERGNSPNAGLRYDEGEDRLEFNRGDGSGYQTIPAGVYRYDGSAHAKQPSIVADGIVMPLAGGLPNESVQIDIPGLPGTTLTPIAATVTLGPAPGDAVIAVSEVTFITTGAGALRITAWLRDVTGGNLPADNVTIYFIAVFTYV